LRKSFRVEVSGTTGRSFAPYVRKHLQAARRFLKTAPKWLGVVLIGDRQMAELHYRFINIDGPTDVLTFPLDEDEHGVIHGEVYVCVPEARRRASEIPGRSVRDEVLLYALHGMLHLCGMDDRTDRGYRRMHRLEDSILRRIGVGPLFHLNPPPTKPITHRKSNQQKGRRAR